MKLDEYKSGDQVEVQMVNPQTDDIEWRAGKVIGIQMIHPAHGQRHKPYPMAVIKTIRTYCKATPKYRYLKGSVKRIKVFVDNTLRFYDKENTEGFIYDYQVRLLK